MPPILDPSHLYDYLTRARARVLAWTAPLTPEQYTREFPIGPGSLAKIFNHTLIAEWYYALRILDREVPPIEDILARERSYTTLAQLQSAWRGQAADTRAALAAVTDWHAPITYLSTDDQTGQVRRITATPTDIASQIILHEVHHRAQALNILRHLGVHTDDIDYNMFMYSITDAGSPPTQDTP